MSFNISGNGIQGWMIASSTFPVGFSVTQFADDTDPLDLEDMEITGTAMGLNGDQLIWTQAKSINFSLNIIPLSDDDNNFSLLFNSNRAAKNKRVARDKLTLVFNYPNGDIVTLTGGTITKGVPFSGIQSSGRTKTKTYGFSFENAIRVPGVIGG